MIPLHYRRFIVPLVFWPALVLAQPQPQPPPPPKAAVTVDVVGTTPLPGLELPIDKIPAPVQTATEADLEASGALGLADFLNRRINGVYVNEVQGNPFQPDINYRGYTASPLLGTPQGLSVFMDGVRLNQPFGEVVSWDLIPRIAIRSTTLMPGSNPLFGLNTLGGALAIQTKGGRTNGGSNVQATYGNHARRAVEFEHGGSKSTGVNWYVAGNLFAEDGWRDASPSEMAQLFGKVGWRGARAELDLSSAFADTSLTGNGLQDMRLLAKDYTSVYTSPDLTENGAGLVSLAWRFQPRSTLVWTGNGYYRNIHTDTFNGDINEDSLDQPPGSAFNGLLNRTATHQHNAGASVQATRFAAGRRVQHQLTAGGAFDRSGVGFAQTSELGTLNADRTVTGSGEFDTDNVELDSTIQTASLYATDVMSAGRWHVTLSGRFNRTTVENRDALNPGGGPGSLNSDQAFARFNPAAGVTYTTRQSLNLYAGYSEGNRAPTSIELGCADPDRPCRLPNAMAGDPPLDQVVTRTIEAGLRGSAPSRLKWNAGVFLARNDDDILFVSSEQTGFGYFRNFGRTRRTGAEFGVEARVARFHVGAGYTFLSATYRSDETVDGTGNSTNDVAQSGARGFAGTIAIASGDRIPMVPRHSGKAYADIDVTSALTIDIDVVAASSMFARGNENNLHQPDGIYYLGPGTVPGYCLVNVGGRYRVTRHLQVVGQLSNLFDRHFETAAQLGAAGFTSDEVHRPVAATDQRPVPRAPVHVCHARRAAPRLDRTPRPLLNDGNPVRMSP